MLKEIAKVYYTEKDFNCAESVVLAANEMYGLGLDTANCFKLIGAFGGGMGCGGLCGALAGSLAVLGVMLIDERAHITAGFREQCASFVAEFEAEMTARDCSVIKPLRFVEGKRCFDTVAAACDLLEARIKTLRG